MERSAGGEYVHLCSHNHTKSSQFGVDDGQETWVVWGHLCVEDSLQTRVFVFF